MSRKKQNFIPSTYYHLSNIGNTGGAIFINRDQVNFFIHKFNCYTQGVFTIIAYCILHNQYHFIIRTRSRKKIIRTFSEYKRIAHRRIPLNRKEISLFLSRIVADFCNSYAKAYNKGIGRKGSLFRENFRKRLLNSHEEMVMAVKALEHLPANQQITGYSNIWIKENFDKPEYIHLQRKTLEEDKIRLGEACILESVDMHIIRLAKELHLE